MMPLHQQNKNLIDDTNYIKGALTYLVEGNPCVLLDGRRTPGIIEKIDLDSGMFIWRIKDFEDEGKFWELPFEDIHLFQFLKDANQNEKSIVDRYESIIKEKQKKLDITIDPVIQKYTIKKIEQLKKKMIIWLDNESRYFKSNDTLDWTKKKGNDLLSDDLKQYLKSINCLYLEDETTNQFCLNPYSGELIKGMCICLAEMGLVDYHGFEARKSSTFSGLYKKEIRKKYLLHRLSFMQALFEKANQKELTIFRGMTSEKPFKKMNRPLLSTTAHLETAKAFFDDSINFKHKSAYIIKLNVDVKSIFMTYLETNAFNRQYLEQEIILLNTDGLPL